MIKIKHQILAKDYSGNFDKVQSENTAYADNEKALEYYAKAIGATIYERNGRKFFYKKA